MTKDLSFQEAVADVKPLSHDKADIGKHQDNDVSLQQRREAAIAITAQEDNYLNSSYITQRQPQDTITFKRAGVQDGVFKQLRQGKYLCEAHIDLHRMTIEEACKAVFEFVQEAMNYNLRTVMITHGKGDRSKDKKAVLKSYCAHWLEQIPEVLAFHSAQNQHGGTGALYILLKKSPSAKDRDREKQGIKT